MAAAEDYVGMVFGSFTVGPIVGAGAEAEVYQILHRGTGQSFVMRLDANDEATWQDRPLNPPRNASVELNNIRGSWHATHAYHSLGYMTRKDEQTFVFSIPEIYGIKELRYLIPMSTPFCLKGSISFDRFLQIAQPDDLYLFELWEDVVLSLLGDTYELNSGRVPEAEWSERWSLLLGGQILRRAMSSYMEAGTLSAEEKDSIIRRIGPAESAGPELAENVILRACGAVSRGYASLAAMEATVRSSDFRINLTVHEAEQIVACWKVLSRNPGGVEPSMSLLSTILNCLREQPPSMTDNGEEFGLRFGDLRQGDYQEFRNRLPIDGYELFFQRYGGASQEFLTFG